jgi:hypothetical protein
MMIPRHRIIASHGLTAALVAAAFMTGWNMPRDNQRAERRPAPAAEAPDQTDLPGTSPALSSPVVCPPKDSALTSWRSALTLKEGTLRDLEIIRAWRHLAAIDPDSAWRESFHLTDGAELRATLDPDAATATAWVASVPEEYRLNASLEAASLLMKRSPREALQWAARISDPDIQHDARLAIVAQWGRQDAPAAAAWCLGETESAGLLPAVLQSWAAVDLMSASEWLAAQPTGPARDAAALALIEPLLELEPASALAWAHTLTDPEMRAATEQRIAAAMP